MRAFMILLFFLSLSSFGVEFLPPRVQLIEFSAELDKKDRELLSSWAHDEMWRFVKKAREEDKRSLQLMQVMTLYRLTVEDKDFNTNYMKMVMGRDKTVAARDVYLKAMEFPIERLSKGDLNSRRFAWFFYDYLAAQYPDVKKYSTVRDSLPKGNWMTVIPGYEHRFDVSREGAKSKPDEISGEISVAKGYELKARKTQQKEAVINGLIVITLSNGKKQGMATEITAKPFKGQAENGKAFIDQIVGLDMKRSVGSAMLALQKRYPYVSPFENVVLSFEDRESMKDGNSAGVAFSLLLYSLYEGMEIDPSIAVTGVIMPDCEVKAVGGVPSKIRGAWKKGLKVAVIPEENKAAVGDLTLMYEMSILWNIQIFTASQFTEVLPIAKKQKDANVKESISRFSKLADILNKGNQEIIKNKAHILKELDEIIKLTPNHESAQVLKRMLSGNRPKTLSLNGSVDFVFMMIERILGISPAKAYESSEEIITKNRAFLKRNIPRLSQESHAFAGEVLRYIESLLRFRKLMVLNFHNDRENIGTALNMMDKETEDMEESRERLQEKWEKLQKKLQ